MNKPSINPTEAKQTAIKLTAGVTLVASAYSGIFTVLDKHVTNVPDYVTEVVTAVIVVSLVCVLAQNETPAKKK